MGEWAATSAGLTLHMSLRLRMVRDAARGMLFLHSHKPTIIHGVRDAVGGGKGVVRGGKAGGVPARSTTTRLCRVAAPCFTWAYEKRY